MRRFVRGLLWGGFLGALLTLYLSGSGRPDGDGEGARLRRLRRAALEEAAREALREPGSSRLQLALNAGRAAVDATLALLGRRV